MNSPRAYERQTTRWRVGTRRHQPGSWRAGYAALNSRIAAKAEGGEILVADTVRGLCSGKGFLLVDFGEFTAKGFEDPVRIYEVNWRADNHKGTKTR